jgi:hypothetical protein
MEVECVPFFSGLLSNIYRRALGNISAIYRRQGTSPFWGRKRSGEMDSSGHFDGLVKPTTFPSYRRGDLNFFRLKRKREERHEKWPPFNAIYIDRSDDNVK